MDRIPTRKPTFSVLVMALVKEGILKIRRKTFREKPPSPTKLSTSRIARGYRINTVKNVTRTTMVHTITGSAISFFRSSAAPWLFAMGEPPFDCAPPRPD